MIYELYSDDVGKTLASMRSDMNLSLREAAGSAGISASTLSRIERGHVADARFDNILALCNVYDTTVEELLDAHVVDRVSALEDDVVAHHGRLNNLYGIVVDLVGILGNHPEFSGPVREAMKTRDLTR
jgi:transcriptional regulator with XRE-family HTH domain